MNDSISEIRSRWRIKELVTEWRRLPKSIRDDVIGELEECARETGEGDPEGARARLIAADALETIANTNLLQGIDEILKDVQCLLEEIDRLGGAGEPG